MIAYSLDKNSKSVIDDIEIKNLKVDESYQRKEKVGIKKIVSDFNPDLLNVIVLSQRGDYSYYIIDGQQRVAACKIVGFDTIKAQIFIGLTIKEEAAIFNKINGNRTNMTAIEKFKAKLVEENQVAVELNEIFKSHGYKISNAAKGEPADYTVNAISEFEAMWREGTADPWYIETILKINSRAWKGSTKGLTQTMIRGINSFLVRYRDEMDLERLIEVLSRNTPDQIKSIGHKYQELFSSKSGQAVGIGIWKEYNKGLRKNKLSEWRQ